MATSALVGVESDLLDRPFELRLCPFAGVLGDERRVLAVNLLLEEIRVLFFLVQGDVVFGISLQELRSERTQRLVYEILFDDRGLRPLFELGDERRHVGRCLPLPVGFDADGSKLALFGPEVEPRRANVGAIEHRKHLPPLDHGAERDLHLADDTRARRTDLHLPILIGLDPSGDSNFRREHLEVHGRGIDPSDLEFSLGEHDFSG